MYANLYKKGIHIAIQVPGHAQIVSANYRACVATAGGPCHY